MSILLCGFLIIVYHPNLETIFYANAIQRKNYKRMTIKAFLPRLQLLFFAKLFSLKIKMEAGFHFEFD